MPNVQWKNPDDGQRRCPKHVEFYNRINLEDKFVWLVINPLNAELNPICHLLALLGAHHILHVSRIRVNPLNNKLNSLNAELNPTCHLLALLGAHHILHVSRIRVNPLNNKLNPLNAELNPICHLLALLGAHHILHVSRIKVKINLLRCTAT